MAEDLVMAKCVGPSPNQANWPISTSLAAPAPLPAISEPSTPPTPAPICALAECVIAAAASMSSPRCFAMLFAYLSRRAMAADVRSPRSGDDDDLAVLLGVGQGGEGAGYTVEVDLAGDQRGHV